MRDIAKTTYLELSQVAWAARKMARVHGPTMVGCAVLDEDGRIFSGCNIEHRFRSHDIHAEVNAISSLIAGGGGKAVAILIAATRERFTPCGSCMDWIFEIGSSDCVVISERDPAIAGLRLTASELMPFYPY